MKKTALFTLTFLATLPSYKSMAFNDVYLTKFCAGTAFRETPFADIRCTKELTQAEAEKIRHFQFDYDKNNRLTEVRYMFNGKLQPYSDRFVRAPRTKISYETGKEIRQYFDAMNNPTIVSGHVYKTEIELDEKGRRSALAFFDIHNNPVADHFDIASYRWQVAENGDVIEHRYDLQGNLQRNRPGFGYMVTKFSWDANGLLTRMYNLGKTGDKLTADSAGIAMTQIGYSKHAEFTQWLNLDLDGNPKRGMSNIAEIRYIPSIYGGEGEAWFFDADGSAQTTNWGAHRVRYQFDQYSNITERHFYNTNNKPTNVNSGIGMVIKKWSRDGQLQLSEQYFDINKNPVNSTSSGVHKITFQYDNKGRLTLRSFSDVNGTPVTHKGLGYTQEKFDHTPSSTKTSYFNENQQLTNNTLGYAIQIIKRNEIMEIIDITYTDKQGKSVPVVFAANH